MIWTSLQYLHLLVLLNSFNIISKSDFFNIFIGCIELMVNFMKLNKYSYRVNYNVRILRILNLKISPII